MEVNSIQGSPVGEVADESKPIVSVNDGPRARLAWGRWVVFGGSILLVLVAAYIALARISFRDAIIPQSPQRTSGISIDSNQGLDTPLPSLTSASVTAATSPVSPPLVSVGNAGDCPDQLVKDAKGALVIGPDGLPVTVTCDGRSVARPSAPTVSVVNAASVTFPPDRFSGGIIIEPPPAPANASGLPAVPLDALAVLQRAQAGLTQAANTTLTPPTLGGQSTAGGPLLAQIPTVGASPGSEPAATQRRVASRLDQGRTLALRGTQIECFLTLAYVSDFAGEATCVIARDVYGHDGTALLIDRGSTANGVFSTTNSLGDRRAFVLWDRIVTPGGVVVTLASPGTDPLGATGLPAQVDQRLLDRLGVASAFSLVKDLTTAVLTRSAASQAASQFVSSGQNFADQILAQTLAIRPSLYIKQGDATSIVLRQDLDFSAVAALRR